MINPYASPQAIEPSISAADMKLRAVSRIFLWVGVFGSFFYVPMVIGCIISLVANLAGHPISNPRIATPLVLSFAAAFNSLVLSLWIAFIITSWQIAKRQHSARLRALLLSVLMMLGFPILTIPGIACFRWIRKYFRSDAAQSAAD